MSTPQRGGCARRTGLQKRTNNHEGKKTVTTAAVVAVPSFVTRAGQRLRNWGSKIMPAIKRVGNWFVKGAKWLIRTPAIRWIVAKDRKSVV